MNQITWSHRHLGHLDQKNLNHRDHVTRSKSHQGPHVPSSPGPPVTKRTRVTWTIVPWAKYHRVHTPKNQATYQRTWSKIIRVHLDQNYQSHLDHIIIRATWTIVTGPKNQSHLDHPPDPKEPEPPGPQDHITGGTPDPVAGGTPDPVAGVPRSVAGGTPIQLLGYTRSSCWRYPCHQLLEVSDQLWRYTRSSCWRYHIQYPVAGEHQIRCWRNPDPVAGGPRSSCWGTPDQLLEVPRSSCWRYQIQLLEVTRSSCWRYPVAGGSPDPVAGGLQLLEEHQISCWRYPDPVAGGITRSSCRYQIQLLEEHQIQLQAGHQIQLLEVHQIQLLEATPDPVTGVTRSSCWRYSRCWRNPDPVAGGTPDPVAGGHCHRVRSVAGEHQIQLLEVTRSSCWKVHQISC